MKGGLVGSWITPFTVNNGHDVDVRSVVQLNLIAIFSAQNYGNSRFLDTSFIRTPVVVYRVRCMT